MLLVNHKSRASNCARHAGLCSFLVHLMVCVVSSAAVELHDDAALPIGKFDTESKVTSELAFTIVISH